MMEGDLSSAACPPQSLVWGQRVHGCSSFVCGVIVVIRGWGCRRCPWALSYVGAGSSFVGAGPHSWCFVVAGCGLRVGW